MIQFGIAVDGGKDSLSMAAHASGEVVKAPGNLVVSAYVTCPDITKTVTPDLKLKDDGILVHIDLAKGKRRLGGSALAQVFDQIGDECPDVDDVPYLKTVFDAVQDLLTDDLISAGHDISDGGLIVSVLEMAFAGNCGAQISLYSQGKSIFETLYSEELGLVLEISKENIDKVTTILQKRVVFADVDGEIISLYSLHLGKPRLVNYVIKPSRWIDFSTEASELNITLEEGAVIDVKLSLYKLWILKEDGLVLHN